MAEPEVIITGERSKLPPEIAALLDPAAPLPAGVVFFEKRFELGAITRRLMMAIGLAVAAIVIIPFGVYCLFHNFGPVTVNSRVDYLPLVFGLVLALASWMLFATISTAQAMRRRQAAGLPTRYGTFLLPAALVQASESDTTVIPPMHFLGLDGATVKYQLKGVPKSYRLPRAWMNASPADVQAAISRWATG